MQTTSQFLGLHRFQHPGREMHSKHLDARSDLPGESQSGKPASIPEAPGPHSCRCCDTCQGQCIALRATPRHLGVKPWAKSPSPAFSSQDHFKTCTSSQVHVASAIRWLPELLSRLLGVRCAWVKLSPLRLASTTDPPTRHVWVSAQWPLEVQRPIPSSTCVERWWPTLSHSPVPASPRSSHPRPRCASLVLVP